MEWYRRLGYCSAVLDCAVFWRIVDVLELWAGKCRGCSVGTRKRKIRVVQMTELDLGLQREAKTLSGPLVGFI